MIDYNPMNDYNVSHYNAYGGHTVECPYCGAEHNSLNEYLLEDEDTVEIDCECGNSFHLICSISVSYRAFKKTPTIQQET